MLVLVVVGCAEPPPALEFTSNPIAVGATARGELPGLADATLTPADVFSLSTTGDRLSLVAQVAGTANLSVITDEDFAITRVVEAVAIDQVLATPTRSTVPCELPALFTVGARASIPVEVHGGGRRLNGEVVPPVVASGAAIVVPEDSADGTLEVRLPGEVTTVQLTSPVDAAFSLALETIAPSAVDQLTLGEPDGYLIPIVVVDVPIVLAAGGRTLCGDTLTRTVVIETPDTCKLADGATRLTASGFDAVRLRGHHSGACTIRVSLDGTPLTMTKTLTVSM